MSSYGQDFKKLTALAFATLAGFGASSALAVTVAPVDLAQTRVWASAKLEGKPLSMPKTEGLVVYANNDPVQKRERNGKPMNISGTQYTRGLYCHAQSHVLVRLPAAGKKFKAEIGVDSNSDTSGGRGSVKFIVRAGDKELYRSDEMNEGQGPISLSLDLDGKDELVLLVDSCGEISCDQADWANARVELENGASVWLDELPFIAPAEEALSTEPFFSFNYDGKPSAELLKEWNLTRSQKSLDLNRLQHELVWTDPKTGLQVRCQAIEYKDYPTLEWTVYFKNTGEAKTPILSNIRGVDVTLPGKDAQFPVLHHHTGSPSRNDDYRPYTTTLGQDVVKHLNSDGGRGTDGEFPYFNLEFPGNGGAIVVVGWPGQWAADFSSVVCPNGTKGLKVAAGQELTHLYLNPGEEIRTPLIVVQFWSGTYYDSQNVWRSWMLSHNVPHPYGELPPLHWAACSSHQYAEMIKADTASQINYINRYLEEGIKLDYWWMDAGWYVNEWGWPNTGTWEVDVKRFPKGLREITDHGRTKGVKSIVWFEPERVTPKTWLYENHQDWMLKDGQSNQDLLNLGHPEAWDWLVNHIDGLIVSEGIDLYRQDYNIAPLQYWRKTDSPDRQGITENKYVVGYLAYWDELLKRHPNMLIDSCASGGRRNDLETMRRAVPLLRSDYIFEPVGNQGHTYGIASWIPLFGTGVRDDDPYRSRSTICPFINSCFEMRPKEADYTAKRAILKDWTTMKPFYLGDYYPLTPYSLDETQWVAWQFDRPDMKAGAVQAFRHSQSVYESVRLKLHGLEPEAEYLIQSVDDSSKSVATGSELMDKGLRVQSQHAPEALIITYKKISE